MEPSAIERHPGAGETALPADALARIFEQQRARSRAAPPPSSPLRADCLRRLRGLLLEHRGPLAEAISADFGHRSRHETALLGVNPVLDGIMHSLRHGRSWMRPRRRRPGYKFLPGTAWLMPQPLGVDRRSARWPPATAA